MICLGCGFEFIPIHNYKLIDCDMESRYYETIIWEVDIENPILPDHFVSLFLASRGITSGFKNFFSNDD